ncbi:MAG TPA: hypothetical protein VH309_08055 [Elusimicrobiota bacterium]|nr:hypothetical protein [Elusimicrobiota bacterium]
MRRTQILLEDSQHQALVSLSRRTGRGLSALIRGAIDRMLDGGKPSATARKLSDIRALGSDPGGPAASEHDRLLYGGAE